MISGISLQSKGLPVIRSFPQMPIKKAEDRVIVIDEYRELANRFVLVTIKLDDFAAIATSQGYVVAEAALAMFNDNIYSSIIGTKSIIRVDISTIVLALICNEIDSREVIEGRIKKAIINASDKSQGVRLAFAVYPDDGNTSEKLLHRMKVTMPASWELNNNKIMSNGVNFNDEIKNGNILTYLQGVYSKEKDLQGVELLSRWKKDDVGVIPPSEFIEAILSQNATFSFISLLLNNAVDVFNELKAKLKKEVFVAINLNPSTLMNGEVVKLFTDFASVYDVSFIEIELVETDDFDRLIGFHSIVQNLSSLGYKIAIDDFGSRYAWINSIVDSVDTLKLDRSLTQRISKGENNKKAALVVKSVVNMANELKLKVIAEGIEDSRDFDAMVDFGVTGLQGFFFGAPMSLNGFVDNYLFQKENQTLLDEMLTTSLPSFATKRH
jgi:EAL domain-containing protein (putative c-di-GMP-specific phosphodiesterase class I)/GGDEF domain-containing protein